MPGLPVEVAGAEAQGGPSELRLCSPGSVAWWWCALSVSLYRSSLSQIETVV